jgi:sugar lactone lactonase YvrE
MNNVKCVFKGICHLGEGPVWNVQLQRLFWTDIYNRRIWMYDPASGSSSIFWEGALQVGGFAFTRSGGVVLCSDKGVHLLAGVVKRLEGANGLNQAGGLRVTDDFHAEPVLLFDIPMRVNEMFNDITVDPNGRIFAGTISRPDFTDGTLYRFEKGKDPAVVLKDLYCSNGMTFSLDEKTFFHTDSTFHKITKYDYDRETGNITNPRSYFQGTPEMGSPDGMTMDSEGYIWAAFWGGSCIRRLDPEGRIAAEILLPAKQPSSTMFGGEKLDELYITTACEGADNIMAGYCNDGVFLGGPVYRGIPGVAGRAEWLADF